MRQPDCDKIEGFKECRATLSKVDHFRGRACCSFVRCNTVPRLPAKLLRVTSRLATATLTLVFLESLRFI